jgi:hypothetical protein
MAENKKSFVAYCDWQETFEELSDEEAGKLVKHLFNYVNDKNPDASDKLTKMCFIPIKQSLKRDLKKYEGYIEKQSVNGKKGGRPKNPTLSEITQPFIEKPKKADSVSVSDSVSVTKSNIDSNKLLSVFNSILGKKTRVVPDKANKQLKAALKAGYSKDDIVTAITNASKDPHHVDSNYKYLTLEFITRPDKLDRFINMSDFTIKSKMI